jgi:hypothetical protein
MNLDQALRDAAEPVPVRVGQAPAQALLDRIIQSPAPAVVAPARPTRPAWRSRKTAVAALAAVAAAAAAVVLPTVVGSAPAYASWTPDPAPLPAADQAGLADRCAAQAITDYELPEQPRTVLGEQRGDYAYLNVVTQGWSATCFRDGAGTVRNASIMVDPLSTAALGRRGVEMQAWAGLQTDEGDCRLMAGHVGSDVVGVDIIVHPKSGKPDRTVRATLQDGHFLAWYPERLEESKSYGTELTLRLADGSKVEGLFARDLHEAPVTD